MICYRRIMKAVRVYYNKWKDYRDFKDEKSAVEYCKMLKSFSYAMIINENKKKNTRRQNKLTIQNS